MGKWLYFLWLADAVATSSLVATASDPIAGGAGWVGAGLLGAVLMWLCWKHLPDKDKFIKEQQAAHDAQQAVKDERVERIINSHLVVEAAQRDVHAKLEREQRAEFRATLDQMLDHNRRQVEGLGNALRADLQALKVVIESLEGIVQLLADQYRGGERS